MVTKIETWKTDDGEEFNSEVEALRHEVELLQKELDNLRWQQSCQSPSNINNNWKVQPESPSWTGVAPNSQTPPLSGFIRYDWREQLPSYYRHDPDQFRLGTPVSG